MSINHLWKSKASYLLLFFVISSSSVIRAQNEYLDQLSEEYNKANSLYKSGDHDQTLKILERLVEKESTPALEKAFAYVRMGIIYDRKDQYVLALEFYDKAEEEAAKQSDQGPLRNLTIQRVYAYKFLSRYDDCLEAANFYIEKFGDEQNHYQLAYLYKAMVEVGYNSKMDLTLVQPWIHKMMFHSKRDTTGKSIVHTVPTEIRFYREQGNLPKAAKLLKANLNLSDGLDIQDISNSDISTLQLLAAISMDSGDEELGIEYLEAIKKKMEQLNANETFKYYEILANLMDNYTIVGRYEEAWELILKIEELMETLNFDDPKRLMIAAEKGKVLMYLKRFDEAEPILLETYKKRIDTNAHFYGTAYNMLYIARLYQDQEMYQEGLIWYQKVVDLFKENVPGNFHSFTTLYINFSDCYIGLKDYQKAMDKLDSSFFFNQNKSFETNDRFTNVTYPRRQLTLYHAKLDLLTKWYETSGNPDLLANAVATSEEANKFIEQILRYTVSDNSKIKAAKSIYQASVKVTHLDFIAGNTQAVYHGLFYSNKLKSFFLKEQSFLKDAIDQKLIDSELIQFRDSLQDRLYMVSEKPAEVLVIYQNLDSITQIVSDKISYSGISTAEIEQISNSGNLISYQQVDDKLYRFYKGNNGYEVDQVSLPENFSDSVLLFRKSLIAREPVEPIVNLISKLLIPESLAVGNKLTIVPDGILNYIPFEILKQGDQYLFENYNISYRYGIDPPEIPTKQVAPYDLLAMAPSFGTERTTLLASNDVVRNTITPLPGAKEEVKSISEIFEGEVLTDGMATEQMFIQKSGNYSILHLATHAIVDDKLAENSKLIFTLDSTKGMDGYLTAKEIARMNLNANLVTLSACNTGFGQIKEGEGVMSLSRAFAYAGVPSTVVSLWPASDKSTPEIMSYFYQNLKDGHSKDEALNNARKTYLKNAKGNALHPFYWGGFVVIGDNSPIQRNIPWPWIIAGILILIGVVYLVQLRQKSDHRTIN